MRQHFLSEIAKAVACCLLTDERASVGKTLTCQHTLVSSGNALIHSKEVTNLPCANANVPCGHVHSSADMAVELSHEALAKAHDFPIALPLRIKVGAALAAANRHTCKSVFENLLKAKEFHNPKVYGRMEANAALVGADGAVKLSAVATVDLHVAQVIYPAYTEDDASLRLYKTSHNTFV